MKISRVGVVGGKKGKNHKNTNILRIRKDMYRKHSKTKIICPSHFFFFFPGREKVYIQLLIIKMYFTFLGEISDFLKASRGWLCKRSLSVVLPVNALASIAILA